MPARPTASSSTIRIALQGESSLQGLVAGAGQSHCWLLVDGVGKPVLLFYRPVDFTAQGSGPP